MTTATTQSITADQVLDSRDIIDRCQSLIEQYLPAFNEQQELEGDEDLQLEIEDAIHSEHFMEWIKQSPEDEIQEMGVLIYLWRECENFSDWSYGETLIRDDYFTDYAREMLEDCGTIPKDIPWYVAIDWEKTADNIKDDYTYVDFMGETYWIRNC